MQPCFHVSSWLEPLKLTALSPVSTPPGPVLLQSQLPGPEPGHMGGRAALSLLRVARMASGCWQSSFLFLVTCSPSKPIAQSNQTAKFLAESLPPCAEIHDACYCQGPGPGPGCHPRWGWGVGGRGAGGAGTGAALCPAASTRQGSCWPASGPGCRGRCAAPSISPHVRSTLRK